MKSIIITLLLLSGTLLLLGAVKETKDGVVFTIEAPQAEKVTVAGDFNNWNQEADIMHKNSDGLWSIVKKIPPGKYAYKFVIDGSWQSDSENPETTDDGYGGTNSVITVGDEVEPKTEKASFEIPSGLNPKVYFNGRYYTKYNMIKEDDMNRYSLLKPYHDLNLGIKVKLADNIEAYTLLNANNTREGVDMWKTHLNFRRTWMKLDADYLQLFAFDDYGIIAFDDPLQIVGNKGFAHYDFGWNYRGISFKTDEQKLRVAKYIPFDFQVEAFGADSQGNDERDVLAGRFSADYDFKFLKCNRNFNLGASWYESRVNNQTDNPVTEDPVYIVDSNPAWEIDWVLKSSLIMPGWQNNLDMYMGYEHLQYENLKKYKDYKQESYEFIEKEEFVWQEGNNDHIFMKVVFPAALSLKLAFTKNNIDLHYEDMTDSISVLPSPIVHKASLAKNTWDFTSSFELENLSLYAGFSRWNTEYPDSNATWNDYYRHLERNNGNGRWYQEYNELDFSRYLLLGYETGFIWNLRAKYQYRKFSADYGVNIAQRDVNYKPELIENFLRLDYRLNRRWSISHDLRIPFYNSDFLGLKTDISNKEDLFASGYTALVFNINENVMLALGYGVNPWIISDVTDEYYYQGRREYLEEAGKLDEYLHSTYNGFGQVLRNAENKLEKDNRISIEAYLKF